MREDARHTLIVPLVLFHENGDLMGGHFLCIEVLQRRQSCELREKWGQQRTHYRFVKVVGSA
jgi:hypothetical protein